MTAARAPTANAEAVVIVTVELPALALVLGLSLGLGDPARASLAKQGDVLEAVSALVQDIEALIPSDLVRYSEADSNAEKLEGIRKEAGDALATWRGKLRSAEDGIEKVEKAKERMNSMRDAYYKELLHLREQMHQKKVAEQRGIAFQFDDLSLFNPEEYCFDEDVARRVREKIHERIEAEKSRIELDANDRVASANRQLGNVRFALEQKDQLLRALMTKYRIKDVAALEKAIAVEHHVHQAKLQSEAAKVLVAPALPGNLISRTKCYLTGSIGKKTFLGKTDVATVSAPAAPAAPSVPLRSEVRSSSVDSHYMSGTVASEQRVEQSRSDNRRAIDHGSSRSPAPKLWNIVRASHAESCSDAIAPLSALGRAKKIMRFPFGKSRAPCLVCDESTQTEADGLWTENAFTLMREKQAEQEQAASEQNWKSLLANGDFLHGVNVGSKVGAGEEVASASLQESVDMSCQTDPDHLKRVRRLHSHRDDVSETTLRCFLESIGYSGFFEELLQSGCRSLADLSSMDTSDLKEAGLNVVNAKHLVRQFREWKDEGLGRLDLQEFLCEADLSRHAGALKELGCMKLSDAAALDFVDLRQAGFTSGDADHFLDLMNDRAVACMSEALAPGEDPNALFEELPPLPDVARTVQGDRNGSSSEPISVWARSSLAANPEKSVADVMAKHGVPLAAADVPQVQQSAVRRAPSGVRPASGRRPSKFATTPSTAPARPTDPQLGLGVVPDSTGPLLGDLPAGAIKLGGDLAKGSGRPASSCQPKGVAKRRLVGA